MMHSIKITIAVVNPNGVHGKAKAARSSTNDNGWFQTSYKRAQLAARRSIPRRRSRRSTRWLDRLNI